MARREKEGGGGEGAEEASSLTTRLLDDNDDNDNYNNDTPVVTTTATTTTTTTTAAVIELRGEQQPLQYRDWPFALVFNIQFFIVIALGIIYMNSFINSNLKVSTINTSNHQDEEIITTMTIPILISFLTTIALISIALSILLTIPKSFISCSVWTSAFISLAISITSFSTNMIPLGFLSLFSFCISVCYAISVKNRIPFAAANLCAGTTSIKKNWGVVVIVVIFGGMFMFGYMILWIGSFIGIVNIQQECNYEDNDEEECYVAFRHPHWILPWIFFLFWTQQVFKNVIHTTVAGIVGTWYYDPTDANSCCSNAIGQSLQRSLTYSFGSICFGSLCVAILQTLDWIVNMVRREREQSDSGDNLGVSLLLCCLDCILRMMENIMEFFNKFAFVYVGVYGYRFMTAGKKVTTLLKHKGWTVVINDNLITNALGLMCFVISLLSGGISLLFVWGQDQAIVATVFGVGFFNALLLSMTVMSIIDSAVTTVIVCFAEAPDVLEMNHSDHSREMKEAWTNVYGILF